MILALDDMVTQGNLEAAWKRVSAGAQGAGADGVTVGVFASRLTQNLEQLRSELAAAAYQPVPLLRYRAVKPAGGERLLHLASVRDRLLQAAFLCAGEVRIDEHLPDSCHGYRKGRSYRTAIERARCAVSAGLDWTCCADILAFFDSIDHEHMRSSVEDLDFDPRINSLLFSWVRSAIVDGEDLISPVRGIPQGLSIAPVLSNIFFRSVDSLFSETPGGYLRYGDDVLFLARSERECARHLFTFREALETRRLLLNEAKTQIAPASQMRFLGKSLVLPEPAREETNGQPAAAVSGATRSLIVCRPGCALRRQGRQIGVFAGEECLLHLTPRRLRQVHIYGNSFITLPALRTFARLRIPVFLLSATGDYWASIRFPADGSLELQRKQWSLQGTESALGPAKHFVKAKLENCATLLRSAGLSGKCVRRLIALGYRSERAKTHGELMGVEGAAASAYFESFSSLLPAGFGFQKRSRRPPADPANSLLSFAYSLLHQNVNSALVFEGLDPRLGFLHCARDEFSALASDLMEEFRAPVADAFVLTIFAEDNISADQFQMSDRGCWMNAPLRRRFLQKFEAALWKLVPGTGRNWREQIQWQAHCLAEWLLGRRKEYSPFRWMPQSGGGKKEKVCS